MFPAFHPLNAGIGSSKQKDPPTCNQREDEMCLYDKASIIIQKAVALPTEPVYCKNRWGKVEGQIFYA